MLTKRQKINATRDVRRHDADTGSPEYQIALFTRRISRLTEHLKKNIHDFHSRRGLLRMVSKRRRLMTYLKEHNPTTYKEVVAKLGLKE